jgi:hypothetical protein
MQLTMPVQNAALRRDWAAISREYMDPQLYPKGQIKNRK